MFFYLVKSFFFFFDVLRKYFFLAWVWFFFHDHPVICRTWVRRFPPKLKMMKSRYVIQLSDD